jgi:hypothetical protein
MADEVDLYSELTHWIHCEQNPSFAKASKRKFHSILSKAFSKSRSKRTKSWLLSSTQSWASCARKVLSRIHLPSIKPV